MKKQLTYVLVIVLGLVFVGADVAPTNSSSINATAINGSISETPTGATSAENATTPIPRTGAEACAVSIEDTLNCTACVLSNCTYVQEEYGGKCTDTPGEDQFTMWISHSVAECQQDDNTNATTATPTTTTTTLATTTVPSNTTQSTTTPATTTSTNPTTTTPASTTTPAPTTPATNTTVPTPTAATTKSPAPIPEPSKGGFGWGSFFSGIVFTLGLSAVAYIVLRFYKRRSEGNYHTL